jgi:nucleoside-diphosphate-sugar epimerase
MAEKRRVVLLGGSGYTGRVLAHVFSVLDHDVVSTSRSPARDLGMMSPVTHTKFDLRDRTTWDNIPPSWGLVWLFPAEPLDLVTEFAGRSLKNHERVVVLGTTSSYLQQTVDEVVTEGSQLDGANPRVAGEMHLQELGAVVLRSGGIYGLGRNPLEWLRNGLVTHANKYVNLVHVEDLALTVVAALESSVRGEHFIVTDGTPHQWKEIVEWARIRGFLPHLELQNASSPDSRRLSNAKLIAQLHPWLIHLDLFKELQKLEGSGF